MSMAEELVTDTTSMATPFSLPTVSLNRSMAVFKGDSVWLPYTCHMVRTTGSPEEGLSLFTQPDRHSVTESIHNKIEIVFFMIIFPSL